MTSPWLHAGKSYSKSTRAANGHTSNQKEKGRLTALFLTIEIKDKDSLGRWCDSGLGSIGFGAVHLQGLVEAPVNAKSTVFLHAFIQVLAHFVRVFASFELLHRGFTLVSRFGIAFRHGRLNRTQREHYSDAYLKMALTFHENVLIGIEGGSDAKVRAH